MAFALLPEETHTGGAMARRDTEKDPAELNDDSAIGSPTEGRMPAGGDDVRGVAEEGDEDAFEDDDEVDDADEEDEESL
jgi:hypothetical protein